MRFLLQSIKSDEAAQHPTEAGEMLTASCSVFSLSLSLSLSPPPPPPPRALSLKGRQRKEKEVGGAGQGRCGGNGVGGGRGKGQWAGGMRAGDRELDGDGLFVGTLGFRI